MVLLVERARVGPALAALLGALTGALVNFTMGRHYTFGAASDALPGQAIRYASVSAGSAALNGAGEHVSVTVLGLPYLAARVAVSLLVSVLFNYPLQRSFVFRERGADA